MTIAGWRRGSPLVLTRRGRGVSLTAESLLRDRSALPSCVAGTGVPGSASCGSSSLAHGVWTASAPLVRRVQCRYLTRWEDGPCSPPPWRESPPSSSTDTCSEACILACLRKSTLPGGGSSSNIFTQASFCCCDVVLGAEGEGIRVSRATTRKVECRLTRCRPGGDFLRVRPCEERSAQHAGNHRVLVLADVGCMARETAAAAAALAGLVVECGLDIPVGREDFCPICWDQVVLLQVDGSRVRKGVFHAFWRVLMRSVHLEVKTAVGYVRNGCLQSMVVAARPLATRRDAVQSMYGNM